MKLQNRRAVVAWLAGLFVGSIGVGQCKPTVGVAVALFTLIGIGLYATWLKVWG